MKKYKSFDGFEFDTKDECFMHELSELYEMSDCRMFVDDKPMYPMPRTVEDLMDFYCRVNYISVMRYPERTRANRKLARFFQNEGLVKWAGVLLDTGNNYRFNMEKGSFVCVD